MDFDEKESFREKLESALKPFAKNRVYYVLAVLIDESASSPEVFATRLDKLEENPRLLTYKAVGSAILQSSKKLAERFEPPELDSGLPVQPKA